MKMVLSWMALELSLSIRTVKGPLDQSVVSFLVVNLSDRDIMLSSWEMSSTPLLWHMHKEADNLTSNV